MPKEILDWDGSFPKPGSDRRKLAEAVNDTVERLEAARRPILIGGVELFRERAERSFLILSEKLGVPVVTTVLAKGVFPMDHPLHMGIHMGPFSPVPRASTRSAFRTLFWIGAGLKGPMWMPM